MRTKINDIDNTKLEEAMQAYMKEQDHVHLAPLALALADAELFIPAAAVREKGGFQPYMVKNAQGDLYMPAFTSMKKFPKDHKYQGMLRMQYKQCASMLLEGPATVQGIVLNVFSDNLMLKTQMLELSRKAQQDIHEGERPRMRPVNPDEFRMVVRHNVELRQIPEKLFTQKLEFIQSLSVEALCSLYQAPYAETGQEGNFPYTQDSFEMMKLNIRDDMGIIQIVAPSQFLYQTNCREIYIVWNPLTEQVGYYAVEKGTDKEQGKFYLDAVKEDGSVEKLEEAPADGNVMSRVIELFGGVE